MKFKIFGAIVAAMSVAGVAQAAPVHFGLNAYELVLVDDPYVGANNSWSTANSAAQASTYLGSTGHLATVTSAAENAFLAGLAAAANLPIVTPGFSGAWIGGRSPAGWLAGPESGDAFTFTNFAGAEPNNNGYVYMAIAFNQGTAGITEFGQWLDDSVAFSPQGFPAELADPVIGYFVEYENVADVPLPAGLALLLSGLGLLGFYRRRQNVLH